MYRFLNPLFVHASFAGATGDLKFGCSEAPCEWKYNRWLNDKKYTYWTLQERVMLGSDFVFGGLVQTGFSRILSARIRATDTAARSGDTNTSPRFWDGNP